MLHTSPLSPGERSCKPVQELAKLLLPAGQREKGQSLLLFRDTSASTPSREQLLDNPLCSGLEQGKCGYWCHHTLASFEPRTTGQGEEREFLTLAPNLWRTREQLRASCSLHCHSGQKGSRRKLRTGFSANQGRAMLGTLAAPSPPDTKIFVLSGASLSLWAEQHQDLLRVKHLEDLCGVSHQGHFCSSSIPSQSCCLHHRQPESPQAGEKSAHGGREALLPLFH